VKKLKLRREVIRLVDNEMLRVVGGRGPSYPCTTAVSCTDPLSCQPIVINTLHGCTTAVDCP